MLFSAILIPTLFPGMEERLDLCAAQVFDELPSSELQIWVARRLGIWVAYRLDVWSSVLFDDLVMLVW